MSERRGTLRRVLANWRLRRVAAAFLAFGAAEYGSWLAVLVYAYQQGGTTLAGVIAVVQLLPAAAFAPVAARVLDRRGGAHALPIGYAAQAVTLGATAASVLLGFAPAIVCTCAVAAASAITLTRPAQSALLPGLVDDPAELTAANVVTGWAESVSVLIGPALAGVMIGLDGPGAALAVFAVALAAAAALVTAIGGDTVADTAEDDLEDADDGADGGLRRVLRNGTRVPVLLVLVAVQFAALGALDVLEVVLAVDVLGIGPSGAGYLDAAYGAGGVLGAAGTFMLVGDRRLTGTLLAAAFVSGGAYFALGVSPTVAGAFGLLGVVGVGRAVLDVSSRTILHRVVPAPLRADVFGMQEGLSMLGLALGSISVPLLVHAGGAETAFVTVGCTLAGTALIAAPTLMGAERVAPTFGTELELLRSSALFAMLEAPVLEDLARALERRNLEDREVVVREGEPGHLYYLVAAGDLVVTVGGNYIRTLTGADGFGEIALLRDGIRTATVTADGPAVVYALDRVPFLEAVTGSYGAHRAATALVAERLDFTGA